LPLCREDNLLGKALFQDKPHITWDNFFSGDEIMECAADQGFGLTMTCRRDRLPSGVPKKYFHHAKTPVTHQTKAARFQKPIVAIKKRGQSYLQFTSFQSTSSCNIACVNALNSCALYAQTKQRGRDSNKKQWAIEMNEARDLYLNTYGGIDRMDHLIQNCNMGYRSWKYWHSAMIHGKAMAVVVAYDIYLECCTGNLTPGWKTKAVSFYRFREILARQMLHYSPTDRKYPGDEAMRACTQQNQKKRRLTMSSSSIPSTVSSQYKTSTGVDREHLEQAEPRLCGFLDDLLHHERSIVALKGKSHHVCHCCGHPAYHICTACPGNPALHIRATKGRPNSCFLHYHNTSSFGLWKEDFKVAGNKKKDWHYPTGTELDQSSKDMMRLHIAVQKESTAASTETIASELTSVAAAENDPTWNDKCI